MAYRTSKPLHPTEFEEDHRVKNKRKGGVKTKSLGTKTTTSSIPHQVANISKDTLRLKKTSGKSGKPTKLKSVSVSKVTTGANTKSKHDDSIRYSMSKANNKSKDISEKKYKRKVKKINRKYNRGRKYV